MLTVLSVAYPLARVAPGTAGGAEQVLAQIDHTLVERGARSIVVAEEGSAVSGDLIPVPAPQGALTEDVREAAEAATRAAIQSALRRRHVDVVHLHGIDFASYLPDTDAPVLATLHLPPEWYPAEVFSNPRLHLHCVSDSQARRCPPGARLLPSIRNGVDVRFYRPGLSRHDYVLALGRICPEKGLHHAIDAARTAAVRIVVAGELYRYEAHEQYYWKELDPRLRCGARFVGPVGPERKRRLLAGARCVLVPSLAPETSSLVAMEAAACGTPVIAFRVGALAEIIRDGETGFLVDDTRAMAEAIRRIGEIDPRRCRAHAERCFDVTRTVERYIEMYERLVS